MADSQDQTEIELGSLELLEAIRAARPSQTLRDKARECCLCHVLPIVETESQAATLMARAQVRAPDSQSMIDAIMSQVTGQATPALDGGTGGVTEDERTTKQRRRLLAIQGSIVAALLLVALVVAIPLTQDLRNQNLTQDVAVAAPAETSIPDTPSYQLKRRVVRGEVALNGERAYLVDAGAIQGLRLGDRLAFQPRELPEVEGELEIVALSPYYCATRLITKMERRPGRGDRISLAEPNPRVERALSFLQRGRPEPGAFYGLGILTLKHGDHYFVQEVLNRYLTDGGQATEPTLAAQLGLNAGDRLIQVRGLVISDEADVRRALAGYNPRHHPLSVVVSRDNHDRVLEIAPASIPGSRAPFSSR